MKLLLDRYRRVLDHLVPRAVVWLSGLVSAALLAAGRSYLGASLALISLALILWQSRTQVGADRQLIIRTLLLGTSTTLIALQQGWVGSLAVLGTLLIALLIEPILAVATRPALIAKGLPGLQVPKLSKLPEPMLWGTTLGIAALIIGVLGPGVIAGFVAVLLAGAGMVLGAGQLIIARRRLAERAIRKAVTDYSPRWALYYAGTSHGAYQIRMWLPYLARTGAPGMVIIRDRRFLDAAAAQFDLPVVLARTVEATEYLIVPGLDTFFYVNNNAKNVEGVRFAELNHVHLGHGDSDKPASYSATFGMFDKIFVAGEAAVERFAQHQVLVPREKFVIVGRPQVAELEVRSAAAPLPAQPVVLYAPTWRGGLEDSKFGSLSHGEAIVRGLLEAGARVWFRPHPYSSRDAESRVLISRIDSLLETSPGDHRGSVSTAEVSVFACMNASDALVTDISSLASDYLYTNKPLAITDTGKVADLVESYPLARAAVLLPLTGELGPALAALLGSDPMRAVRAELRRSYLGDWPAEEYPEVFVAAAAAELHPKVS